MDFMFKRRLNVKLPDAKNSSMESGSSQLLEAELHSNKSNLDLHNSANVVSPSLRIASLNPRTSEMLIPRQYSNGAEKGELLLEGIKKKYLQKLELVGSQGRQTSRLPFTSPKGSLKTSALSERALSPDPVNTPKLLNLIKDFKKQQSKLPK